MSVRSLYEKCYIFNTFAGAALAVGALGTLAYVCVKAKLEEAAATAGASMPMGDSEDAIAPAHHCPNSFHGVCPADCDEEHCERACAAEETKDPENVDAPEAVKADDAVKTTA